MNMISYNTKEARDQFNQIINHVVETKETVWIIKGKKPAVQIIPIEKKTRHLGLLKGTDFWISDDFDESDKIIEKLFHGDEE